MKGKRHIEIINLYAKQKLFDISDKEKYQSFIKRNARAAILLCPYTDLEIEKVMDWLKKNVDFKWTLESVGKYIDEDLDQLEAQRKAQEMIRLGYWKCEHNYWHEKYQQCGHMLVK